MMGSTTGTRQSAMNNNMVLIAQGNACEAVKAYGQDIQTRSWMEEVNEEDIYAEISSPEFSAYLAILGIDNKAVQHRNAA